MNSINDQEKQMIKEIADKLYFCMGGGKNEKASYFIKRTDDGVRKAGSISEYQYSTPLELQKELRKMWQGFRDDHMQEFVKVCTAAAFKNKEQEGKMMQISSYIYEF